jgi:hypothetical protein
MVPSVVFRRAYYAIQTPQRGLKGDLECRRSQHLYETLPPITPMLDAVGCCREDGSGRGSGESASGYRRRQHRDIRGVPTEGFEPS